MSKKEQLAQNPNEIQVGGTKIIPIETAKGKFNIWTKRIGNNPKVKILLLAGALVVLMSILNALRFLPAEDIEMIYYDQLGCGRSENPKDTSLWDLARYVEEVEQVRISLGLNKDNFYLFGSFLGRYLSHGICY